MPEPKDIETVMREFEEDFVHESGWRYDTGTPDQVSGFLRSAIASVLFHTKGKLPEPNPRPMTSGGVGYKDGVTACHSVIDTEIAKILGE